MSNRTCVICGRPLDGHGNNAEPVKKGFCCNQCNSKHVIPARIREMRRKNDE